MPKVERPNNMPKERQVEMPKGQEHSPSPCQYQVLKPVMKGIETKFSKSIGGKMPRRNPCGTEKIPTRKKMPRDHRTRGDRPPGEPRQDATKHHEKIAHDEALDTATDGDRHGEALEI